MWMLNKLVDLVENVLFGLGSKTMIEKQSLIFKSSPFSIQYFTANSQFPTPLKIP